MSDDAKALLAAGCFILMIFAGFAVPGLTHYHQIYSTFLESQRTVLECRAAISNSPQADLDQICGSVPSPEVFK